MSEINANLIDETPVIQADVVDWKGEKGDKGDPGTNGTNGQDGYSPTATVSKVGTTSTITITDKNGTTTASVEDGETQDLTDYVKNTDYATSSKCGVIITNNELNVSSSNGSVYATDLAYNTYSGRGRNIFISKGTLENVLANKTVSDVKINGTSAKVDGVVDIPVANTSGLGLVKGSAYYSFNATTQGLAYAVTQTAQQYVGKTSDSFVSKGTLNNVLATPSIMPTLTDTEKANARKRIGLGDFELIEEITLTEDSNITRSAFPNGTPYNLKRIRLIFECPIASARYVYMCINGGTSISNNTCRNNAMFNASYSSYGVMDCDVSSGLPTSSTFAITSNTANATDTVSSMYGNGYGGLVNAITSIYVGAYNNTLPSGTVIKIYGVRG